MNTRYTHFAKFKGGKIHSLATASKTDCGKMVGDNVEMITRADIIKSNHIRDEYLQQACCKCFGYLGYL